jgi:hypothetical protein
MHFLGPEFGHTEYNTTDTVTAIEDAVEYADFNDFAPEDSPVYGVPVDKEVLEFGAPEEGVEYAEFNDFAPKDD